MLEKRKEIGAGNKFGHTWIVYVPYKIEGKLKLSIIIYAPSITIVGHSNYQLNRNSLHRVEKRMKK